MGKFVFQRRTFYQKINVGVFLFKNNVQRNNLFSRSSYPKEKYVGKRILQNLNYSLKIERTQFFQKKISWKYFGLGTFRTFEIRFLKICYKACNLKKYFVKYPPKYETNQGRTF